MARPKTAENSHLPPYVKARQSGGRLLYYYQRFGKMVPLGSDYSNAEERAAAFLAAPPPDALGIADEADIISKAVPVNQMSGVYFLILAGRIAYVGQSQDVWRRIGEHRKDRRFDAFSWIACPVSELDALEAHCILKFRPWQNAGVKPNFSTRPQITLASN